MIAITGGGTGGHLTIAKALKEELIKRGLKVLFIGSSCGQDKKWFQNDSDFEQTYFFDTSGVVNKSFGGKFFSLLKILKYSIKCLFIFRKYKVQKVISVGGYSGASASIAGIIARKDLYIHEQNAYIGSLNKTLQPFAKHFFSSYKFEFKNYYYCPYPISNIFFKQSRTREKLNKIIFLGGSQGAGFINKLAMNAAAFLQEQNIKIIHQCGENDFSMLRKFYKEKNIEVDLFAFSNNLCSKIENSDFAVSRSGASTFWELVASKTPALFAPYPYAAGNHQYFNAKQLAKKELCFLQKQEELDLPYFQEIIKTVDVKTMSSNLEGEILEDGASNIISAILFEK